MLLTPRGACLLAPLLFCCTVWDLAVVLDLGEPDRYHGTLLPEAYRHARGAVSLGPEGFMALPHTLVWTPVQGILSQLFPFNHMSFLGKVGKTQVLLKN